MRRLSRHPAMRRIFGLGRERGGTAAVEFAIILPVALLIMSLVVYGGQIYGVQRKVTLAASTVADLFAQGNNTNSATITTAELNQILGYPNLILFPNDPTGIQVVISQLQVTVNSNGTATGTVKSSGDSWANANAQARPANWQITVDPSIASAWATSSSSPCTSSGNCYVILSEVYYPFQPTGLYMSLPQVTLHDSVMMIPRTAAHITVQ